MSSGAKTAGRTTTEEALLGLLSFRPMSGYQLRQLIDESIGNFWRESYGQIYPTLKRLRARGLVELAAESEGGRTESKVYRLTAEGAECLRAWLRTGSQAQVPRNEMLLKIFFSGMAPVGVVREQIAAFRELHAGELRRFQAIEKGMQKARGSDPRVPYWRMTLRYGMAESRAMVAWADESLGTCAALERKQGMAPAVGTKYAPAKGGVPAAGKDGVSAKSKAGKRAAKGTRRKRDGA